MAEDLSSEQILDKAKAEIKFLINKRGHMKASLTRFQTFLNALPQLELLTPSDLVQIETRFKAADSLLQEFEQIQLGIEDICLMHKLPDAQDQTEVRSDFEEKYFSIISKAKLILQATNLKNASNNPGLTVETHPELSNNPINNMASILSTKLPPLSIPEFSGSYESWTQFRGTFEALIDKNPSLPKVQKFYYFQSALKGDAAQIISSLTATDGNYAVAWNLLKERYENKRAIIHAHMKAIFSLPSLKEDNHIQLRKFLDNFQKHYRCLKNLGENVDNWDTPLIYLLTSKFGQLTRREWEIYSKNFDSPSILNLTTFLTERCHLLESIDFKVQNKHDPNPQKSYGTPKTFTNAVFENKCPVCKDSHFVYACEKFLKLPVSEKYSEAKRLKLCTNCLRPGHFASVCTSKHSCRACQRRHHSLLHYPTNNFEKDSRHITSNVNPSIIKQPPQNTLSAQIRATSSNNHDGINPTQLPNPQRGNINPHLCETPSFLPSNQLPHATSHQVVVDQKVCNPQQENNLQPDLPIDYSFACANSVPNTFVLLSTALVYVYDSCSRPIPCRTLLDSGSQSNLISKALFDILNLKCEKVHIPVCGINQGTTYINKKTSLTIKDLSKSHHFNLTALVIDKITDKCPQQTLNVSNFIIPKEITLADPTFFESSEIDLLIGASLFYDLLISGQMKLGTRNPILQNTKLGWVISGPLHVSKGFTPLKSISAFSLNNEFELKQSLEKFWHIEEPFHEPCKFTPEEMECESHFKSTFTRTSSGRFEVSLPLKCTVSKLGDSQEISMKRFLAIERKLTRNPELKFSYTQFIQEYEKLGHMSKINSQEKTSDPIYYLPHHAIEKLDSTTTKLRVVFDALSKTTTGISLNDILMVGPTVQSDLFSIILRFRKHNYVLSGDIAKMYRQILVKPEQRKLQRIVWRDSPESDLNHYELNTITYGTASASFLATRCIQQISFDIKDSYPLESHIIARDSYVDDVLTGCNDLETLIKVRSNLISIFQTYGFELRKFSSNEPKVLSNISDKNSIGHIINDNQSCKALGIFWDSQKDQFIYTSKLSNSMAVVTKRSILSAISQIFDPLGLLSPIIIQGKILMQKLWLLKISWDEPLPNDFYKIWSNFSNQLSKANTFKIHRQVTSKNPIDVQIHGFCDSSINAYGACVYLRCTDSDGKIYCNLLCAKCLSRVAPLKAVSLPRLELCGALLLAKLINKILETLSYPIGEIFYWTDSSIVLCWLSLEPRTLKTFVCNRISEIQQITNINHWYHVISSQNPADIISRGMSPVDLESNNLWWHGPSFLLKHKSFWPSNNHVSNYARQNTEKSKIIDINPKSLIFFAKESNDFVMSLCSKYSSYSKLINVVAYCLRFHFNLKYKDKRITGALSQTEVIQSVNCLVRLIQSSAFPEDLFRLKNNKTIRPSSKLSTLNPFLDSDLLLRVGGRLNHSKLTFNQKHPILIPYNHPFSKLVVTHEHIRNLHPGTQATLSFVRQQFWPTNGKQLVKSVIRKCIICFKYNPRSLKAQMAALPSVRDSKFKNRRLLKCYICLFVCLTTKAIHLELATELTTQSFISAFLRFVSRRGLCKNLHSDNGSNFVGAKNEFDKINTILRDERFQNALRDNKIQWSFIPSHSPHFGGLWEASVKSTKQHLKRVLNNTPLHYEEFYTLLVQIEAILNSRPLTPLSDDPNDLEALTPGHFLIGRPLNKYPELDLLDVPDGRLSRYQHLQKMSQHFWQRWSDEFLHTLHQRFKWKSKVKPSELLGSLVLLKEDNLPSLRWRTGRVVDLHSGNDGAVRVVSVRTSSGVVKRSITKICPLPIESPRDIRESE
ncbi:uncharacterized protein LOC126734641 [Anthonomus grandis grandis]|uniref:uncharacterized protein LOC126734641 n=1 Tax=Anthonomus grandis grandis TaxID=2921223 RepID=UPI002166A4F6|nr:uncharacterized protein LOC126734641 [Anthonomus grandis grandis]